MPGLVPDTTADVRHIRILQCFDCRTMQVMVDYPPDADPEYDVVLHDIDMDHGGQEEETARIHNRTVHRVQEAMWDQPRVRRSIVARMWEGTTGFAPSYYDAQNTLAEDAMKCWTAHRRPGLASSHLCGDYHNDSKRIGNPARKERKALAHILRDDNLINQGPKVYLCQFCPYESDVQRMKADKFGDFSEKLN